MTSIAGTPLDSFRMSAGHQKDQGTIRECWNFHPCPLNSGEVIITLNNDLINHTYVMKTIKPPKQWGLDSFWVTEHLKVLVG